MDYTLHEILQAKILEWVAFPFSRGSSQRRAQTQASHIAGGFFTSWATREAQEYWSGYSSPVDLPNPGIKPRSPALQVDSLPTELSGKPFESESESCSVVSESLWPHGLYSPWNSLGQNTGVGSLSLLQGIFPTKPKNTELGNLSLLQWIFLTRNQTGIACIVGGFFTNWAIREALMTGSWYINSPISPPLGWGNSEATVFTV